MAGSQARPGVLARLCKQGVNPKLRHVTRHTCRSLNRVQAKELTELRAKVEQGKTVESCLRQELDDLNKVFPSPRPHTWPRP